MIDNLDYRPVRVMAGLSVAAATVNELDEKYPHGKSHKVTSPGAKTNTVSRLFVPGQVVDAPTPEERAVFDVSPDSVVVDIRQHADGYDDPRSGVARSRASSDQGKTRFLMETAARANRLNASTKSAVKSKETVDKKSKKGGDK